MVLLEHTTSCPHSAVTSCVLVSRQAVVHPSYRFAPEQHRLAAVCSVSFCRRMFLPMEKQIFSLSKDEVASDAHRFCWILFLSGMHASKNKRESFQ